MPEVMRIPCAIEQGDLHAAEQPLPPVYLEPRRLAAEKMAQEKPGQTLSGTALVHEAYLRLVGDQQFDNRRTPLLSMNGLVYLMGGAVICFADLVLCSRQCPNIPRERRGIT